MNAMKAREALRRKEAEAEMKRYLMKNAERFLVEQEAQEIERQKYNALMHVLRVFVVMNSEFGFGKKRLARLWGAIIGGNKDFATGLLDGIGFTKILNELDRIGFNPIDGDERRFLENRFQRLYEERVKHYGEDVVGNADLFEGFDIKGRSETNDEV